ncbi:phosphorylase family protein [Paenibacillus sp. CAU 1782]
MSAFLDIPKEGCLPACAILTDDPMRVEMFTAHYLEQARLYTRQRGMTGYIGSYGGTEITVQAVGYGGASLTAYLHEMVSLYRVQTVIYAGECISREASVLLRDLVLAPMAYTCNRQDDSAANDEMLAISTLAASRCSLSVQAKAVHSNDLYGTRELEACCAQAGIIDFATHALYDYANKHGIAAISLLSVSECFNEQIAPAERQSQMHGLTRLAFETAAMAN